MLKLERGYYSHALQDLKDSPHWFGRLCVLALIALIPIFGMMVVYGYLYGWARDLAWDIRRPQSSSVFGNEDGKLYSRGAMNWLIAFIYGLIPGVLAFFLQIPMLGLVGVSDSMGLLVSFVSFMSMLVIPSILIVALSLILAIVSQIAIMRSSIYQDFGSAFQLGQIFKMIKHDFPGLLRIVGFNIIATLVLSGVLGAIGLVLAIAAIALAASFIGCSGAACAAAGAFSFLLGMLIFLVICFFVLVAQMFIETINARMMGYWVRQFRVAEWGASSDPFPFERDAVAQAVPAPVIPVVPATQAPAQEPQPVAQAPAQEVQPVAQAPVQETAVVTSAPESCSAPVLESPVVAPAPYSCSAPAQEASPASEETPSCSCGVEQVPSSACSVEAAEVTSKETCGLTEEPSQTACDSKPEVESTEAASEISLCSAAPDEKKED